jgi:hypothetical protein
MHRRDLLKSSLALLTRSLWLPAGAAISLKSFADEGISDDQLFVQIMCEGGLDMIQSLDPMLIPQNATEQTLFRGYADSEMLLNTDGSPLFGPCAAGLKPHLDDLAIIRGVWTRTTNTDQSHEHCRTYMASGINGARRSSTLAVAEVAERFGSGKFGVIANTNREFYNTKYPKVPLTVSRTVSGSLGDSSPGAVAEFDPRLILDQEVDLSRAIPWEISAMDFSQTAEPIKIFRSRYQTVLAEAQGYDPEDVLSAAALSSGLTKQIFLNLGGDYQGPGPRMDLHSGFETGWRQQTWYWDRIASLFKLLKNTRYKNTEDSVFSKTTFFITNEFSRPPMLNGSKGKDHNPETNSVVLAGRGIRGGVSVGASQFIPPHSSSVARLVGRPFHYKEGVTLASKTGTQDENVALITPENVVATLAIALGLKPIQFKTLSSPNRYVVKQVLKKQVNHNGPF